WGGISQSILFMIIAYLTNQKSYLVFSIICLINIISDCISNLLSGISMPIFKHHIPQDELMTAYSLRNIISFICGIGGQIFGIWLLEISNKNFGFVAIINAFSFLISSIILVSIKSLLINNKEKITRHSFSRNFLEMYDASKGIFSTKSDSQFIKLITTVIISNVLGSAIIPIFNLYFLENKWQN
ncbi:TPA: permease, partial [Streptococcus equi subsp. equi]|nr:permease [Streptococcus equi subsp. equi]